MAILRLYRPRTLCWKPIIRLLVVSAFVCIAFLVLRTLTDSESKITHFLSSHGGFTAWSLNNGRNNLSFVPILDPLTTPCGFNNSRIFLVALVSSSPGHLQERNAIRKTWGRAENWVFFGGKPPVFRKYAYKTAFIIGSTQSRNTELQLQKEMAANHDILLGNFTDSSELLNVKNFMAIKWVLSTECKYIMKVEDDVYANIPLVILWLSNNNSGIPKQLYTGYVHSRNSLLIRSRRNNNFVSGVRYFPPFCARFSYIISRDLVSRILHASRVVRPLWIDDVYIGMLVYYLGVKPLSHDGFRLRLHKTSSKELQSFKDCFFVNTFSYGDQLDPKQMVHIHKIFRRMNSRSNGDLVFHCVARELAFTMSRVVPFMLFLITGIAICVGVLRGILLKARRH